MNGKIEIEKSDCSTTRAVIYRSTYMYCSSSSSSRFYFYISYSLINQRKLHKLTLNQVEYASSREHMIVNANDQRQRSSDQVKEKEKRRRVAKRVKKSEDPTFSHFLTIASLQRSLSRLNACSGLTINSCRSNVDDHLSA